MPQSPSLPKPPLSLLFCFLSPFFTSVSHLPHLSSFIVSLLDIPDTLQAPPQGCRPHLLPLCLALWPVLRFHKNHLANRGSASRRPRLRTAIRWWEVVMDISIFLIHCQCVCANCVSCGTENLGEKGLQWWLGNPWGSDHSGSEDRFWILWNRLQGKVAW